MCMVLSVIVCRSKLLYTIHYPRILTGHAFAKLRNKFCLSSISRWQLKWWGACMSNRTARCPRQHVELHFYLEGWANRASSNKTKESTEFIWTHVPNKLAKVSKYSLLRGILAFSIFNRAQHCSWTCTLCLLERKQASYSHPVPERAMLLGDSWMNHC